MSKKRFRWLVVAALLVVVVVAALTTNLAADVLWQLSTAKDLYDKHVRLPSAKIDSGTPDRYAEVIIEKDVPIPMRDGVRLYANVYRPQAEGQFPVIIIRLPYGKDEYYCKMPAIGKFWAKKGYAAVIQAGSLASAADRHGRRGGHPQLQLQADGHAPLRRRGMGSHQPQRLVRPDLDPHPPPGRVV